MYWLGTGTRDGLAGTESLRLIVTEVSKGVTFALRSPHSAAGTSLCLVLPAIGLVMSFSTKLVVTGH
jgi:hypothetical protein